MLEHYSDALIIGTEIPGLITGAFLARRGLNVHVLDPSPYAPSEIRSDPFVSHALHSKLLRSILGRLNVSEAAIHGLTTPAEPLQIIFPKKRIDIEANPLFFYEEMEREFPDVLPEIKQFYENLTHVKHQVETQQLFSLMLPRTFMERRQLNKFAKIHQLDCRMENGTFDFATSPEFRTFIEAQLKLLLTHQSSPMLLYQVSDLLNPSDGAVLSIKGGQNLLKSIFRERIEHHAGFIRTKTQIDKLLFKNGIFEGVMMAGTQGNILTRYLVWNTELSRLKDYLPSLLRFTRLKSKIKKIKPKAMWFTAHFQVPRMYIPSPMQNNVVSIENPGRDLIGTNYLFIQIHDREEEMVSLSVSYLMGVEAQDADDESFIPLHEKILQSLRFLMPFADDKIKLIFPTLSSKKQEGTLFPLKEDDFTIFKYMAKSHPVFESRAKTFSDLFPISYKTASPNLFITSPQILGGFGLESHFMLGLHVTDLIWQDVEKEKKRAMKLEKRIA